MILNQGSTAVGQGVGIEVLLGSRGGPKGSQGVKGLAYWVPGGQGIGLQGPRGSRGSLQCPMGSRGGPTGSQGVKG